MPYVFLFLIITFPLLEIYVLIKAGNLIGAIPTIALVVFSAVLGTLLLRWQGFITLQRVRAAFARGELPAAELLDGLIVLICGVLLLIPGFLSDVTGFASASSPPCAGACSGARSATTGPATTARLPAPPAQAPMSSKGNIGRNRPRTESRFLGHIPPSAPA